MSTSAVAGPNDSDAPQQSARRLRILQVSGSAAGGVRTHLADCARILAADGHDVIVEAPAAGWTSPLPAPRRSRSGPVRVSATLASWPGCVAWGVGPTPSTPTACAPEP